MSTERNDPFIRGLHRKHATSYPPVTFRQSWHANQLPKRWIIWVGTCGVFLPYTFGTTGKYVIAPLFLLAVVRFYPDIFRGARRIMPSDFFVWLTALWIIASEIEVSGSLNLSNASDVLALAGSYTVARAFFFGELALREFVRAFSVATVVLIALSLLDTFSGRFVVRDFFSGISGGNDALESVSKGQEDIHRMIAGFYVLRAASTFPHPILYGTFCTLAAAIFFYAEQRLVQRAFYVSCCLIGCIISISSAPLMGFAIIISLYCYDRALKQYSWRWKAFWIILLLLISAIFLVVNNPLGHIFSYLTFTPETGYYRMLIWQSAFYYISNFPLTGDPSSSAWISDDILSVSVDSFWLVLALFHGLPTVLFFFLANLAACVRIGSPSAFRSDKLSVERIIQMRTSFSMVLGMFAFLGLTVHIWDSLWLFWGLCLGIRTSLEEFFVSVPTPQLPGKKMVPKPAFTR